MKIFQFNKTQIIILLSLQMSDPNVTHSVVTDTEIRPTLTSSPIPDISLLVGIGLGVAMLTAVIITIIIITAIKRYKRK